MDTEKKLYLAFKALLEPAYYQKGHSEQLAIEERAQKALAEYEMMLGPLPDWAVAHNITNELVAGLQLFTRNGRRHGNAHIVSVHYEGNPVFDIQALPRYDVITDAGRRVNNLTDIEVLEGWEPGDFISDPAAVVKRFGRVPDDLLEPE